MWVNLFILMRTLLKPSILPRNIVNLFNCLCTKVFMDRPKSFHASSYLDKRCGK